MVNHIKTVVKGPQQLTAFVSERNKSNRTHMWWASHQDQLELTATFGATVRVRQQYIKQEVAVLTLGILRG